MSKQNPSDGVESPVHHEPLVSETLKEGAERSRRRAEHTDQKAEGDDRLVDEEEPLKRHGDALQHGTGNRHGVHERDRRPNSGG
jgi:hypothetical protein